MSQTTIKQTLCKTTSCCHDGMAMMALQFLRELKPDAAAAIVGTTTPDADEELAN
jgi:nicotinamide mononucleotide (NMN) deamidase PncC